MILDTDNLVAMTEANQNFSKVVRYVDENGMAVILKNNRPRYVVVDFEEYEALIAAAEMRKELINAAADRMIGENTEALLELAK